MNSLAKENMNIAVESLSVVSETDLADLCNITEQAIKAGGGFGWLSVPPRNILNKYWKGVVLIQNRKLIVGRVNKAIAGTLQLISQPSNNEAQQKIFNISSHFVAPWARGYGLAKALIDKAEKIAIDKGASHIQLDVRQTQDAAIQLFKSKGYEQWGTNPCYAIVDGKSIEGLYFFKKLK